MNVDGEDDGQLHQFARIGGGQSRRNVLYVSFRAENHHRIEGCAERNVRVGIDIDTLHKQRVVGVRRR